MTILYSAQWDKGGNRQVIRTGCRPFDTQISALGQGNVFGSTITGWYIRSHRETECNGFTFPEGHLQASDLKVFQSLPPQVDRIVREYAKANPGILYKLFHTSGSHQVVHGYVWSDTDHNLINLWVTGRHSGSTGVVTACLPYLVNAETLAVSLLAEAMTYHAKSTPVPPAGAVFRYAAQNPGDTPIEYCIEPFEDSSRRLIISTAGYVLADKRWCWSDDTTFDKLYFFPASMFDSKAFERIG